jgi:hypothetical protein
MAILPTTTGSKVLINGQPPQVPVTVSSAAFLPLPTNGFNNSDQLGVTILV